MCMIAILIAYAQASIAYAQLTLNTPYDYPIKPGTADWQQLRDSQQQFAACDIPQHIVKTMTTDALVRTCLEYPLRGTVALSPVSEVHGLKHLEERFSGLAELLGRKDAGTALLSQYNQMGSTAATTKQPPSIIDHAFIVALLQRDEILNQFSDQQLYALLRSALQIGKVTRESYGPSASEGYALRLATKLIVQRGVTVQLGNVTFDSTWLDPAESAFFLSESTDYIPEKSFLDKLIELANAMARN